MRIVLDTNVVMSALLWRGTPYRLLDAIRQRSNTQLCSSAALLEELADVLTRPSATKRLALIDKTAATVLADYVEVIELVAPTTVPRVVPGDIDDDQVIAAAVAAQADLIVSGDRKHILPLGNHAGIASGTAAGAIGFCIGGHLALRAAMDARCRAAVCAYPTGVHDGKLGADSDAGTLARLAEIRGELLLVFGADDPHVPEPARQIIRSALASSGVRNTYLQLPGEHAFMRDEGARYDSEMADRVFVEAISLYRRTLGFDQGVGLGFQ